MEDLTYLQEALKKAKQYDEILKYSDIVIWGTGNTTLLYEECIREEKLEPCYYCDSDKSKQGALFAGKLVIAPDSIRARCENPFVLISSAVPGTCREIAKQCHTMGLTCCTIDMVVFSRHAKELMNNCKLLDDDYSKYVYSRILVKRMQGMEITEDIYTANQYFCLPPFMRRRGSEIFVDCGAFVGDSVEQYIVQKACTFGKIYGFEPEEKNYKAFLARSSRLNLEWGLGEEKIVPIHAGVGIHTAEMYMGSVKDGSNVGARVAMDGDNAVKVYALDDFFYEQQVHFLKADIEGFEAQMLIGAEKMIKKNHPLLAVCIYHNAADMYNIMRIIHEMDMTYKFAIRHHSYEYCETVLYAW